MYKKNVKDLAHRKTEHLDTSDLFAETIISLGEGITGIAASDRKDLILSIGHIFQRIRSGRFLETLKHEWDGYRKKGRINDDYMETDRKE